MSNFAFLNEVMSIRQFMITNCDLSIGILRFLFALSVHDDTKFFAMLCTLDRCSHEKMHKTRESNAWSFRSCLGV